MKRKLVFLLPLLALAIALLPLVVSAGGPWSDDFDSYANGTVLDNVGGWKGWDNSAAAAGVVSDAHASSAPHSIMVDGTRDAVHEFTNATSGQWTFSGEMYIEGNFSGQTYLIFLNTYNDGGPYNWSLQICFDSTTGMLYDDVGASCSSPDSLPFVVDAWIPWELQIDLDANTQSFYYNGNLLFTDSWTEHVSGGGAVNIGAIDLWSNGATAIYYDNLSLTTPTAAIMMDKTVGLDPGVCATTDEVNVPTPYEGNPVYYCYTVTNTGDFTLTVHDLVDSELGVLLDGLNYALGPGDSVDTVAAGLEFSATITQPTVNTATWTACNPAPGELQACIDGTDVVSYTDVATVTVGAPTSVSLSGFGGDSGIDATLVWLGVLLVVVTGMGVALRRKAMVER